MVTGGNRVLNIDEARALARQHRREGKRIVFTNGLFDLLHAGHALYLEQARHLGDVLFVGVNSDASAAALKGSKRPIIPASERALLLTCLRAVDYVVVFEGTTAVELLYAIQPHFYVKGGDYTITSLPEAEAAAAVGAAVRFLPLIPNLSTSTIIERITSRYCQ